MNEVDRILAKIDSSTQDIILAIQNETRRFIVVSALINDLEKYGNIYSTSKRIDKRETIKRMLKEEKIGCDDILQSL